ncbi:hypothetical protein PTNB73_05927 [Pyrenophora teres f. teres]|nr:hypothetical protein PTNB73_05927 [Pyrenophora teres f. teres]
MSHRSSTASFEEGPSLDSGIGMVTNTGRKPKEEAAIPSSSSISPAIQKKRGNSTLRATSDTALFPSRDSNHSPLTPRPGTPTIPRFHVYSSIHDHQESSSEQQTIDRVLESPQGRKTPTLFSAPTLHWDLSTPFLANPSVSTLDSAAEEEIGEDSGDEEKKQEPMRKGKKEDSTPPPSLNPNLARELEAKQARQRDIALGISLREEDEEKEDDEKEDDERDAASLSSFSSSSSSSSSSSLERGTGTGNRSRGGSTSNHHIPSLNRTLDTNLRPQPHSLSPVSEASACNAIPHPRLRGKKTVAAAAGATRQGKASRLAAAAQVKVESGDTSASFSSSSGMIKDKDKARQQQQQQRRPPSSTASSLPSLRTASALPFTRLTHADVVRSQVTLPLPMPRIVITPPTDEPEPVPLSAHVNDGDGRGTQQEQVEEAEYRRLVELVRKREKERASAKGKVKRVIGNVRRVGGSLCCKRG